MDAKAVASYFIGESSKLGENNDLTNLKLQKILYYAQLESISQRGVPLFNDDIEAWQYGPVVRDVYEWLRECGRYPIAAFDIELKRFERLTGESELFLKNIWEKYNRYSAWALVEITHRDKSPWSEVYAKGAGDKKVIPIGLIQNDTPLMGTCQ